MVTVKGDARISRGVTDQSDDSLTLDDDTEGVTVSENALDIEEGDDGTYTVVLTSEPTGPVTATLRRTVTAILM